MPDREDTQQLTPNREGKRPGVAVGSTHRLLGARREEEKYLRSRKLSYEEGEGAGATAADLLVRNTRLELRFAEKRGKRKERSTGCWMEAGARGRSEDRDRGRGSQTARLNADRGRGSRAALVVRFLTLNQFPVNRTKHRLILCDLF